MSLPTLARPTTTSIVAAQEAWDTDVNDNFNLLTQTPVPIPRFATLGAFPAAASYDQCFAFCQADGRLYSSRSGAWVPIGLDQPAERLKRCFQLFKDTSGAGTFVTAGLPAAPSSTGTLTSGDVGEQPMHQWASAASSGAVAGLESTFNLFRRGWNPEGTFHVRLVSALSSAYRYWCGFASASLDAAGADPNTTHVAAFRWDQASDPQVSGEHRLRCYTSDGSGNSTVTTTDAPALATGVNYEKRIELDADLDQVRFYVDGGLVAVHEASAGDYIPSEATLLGYLVRVIAQEAAAKSIRFSRATFFSR